MARLTAVMHRYLPVLLIIFSVVPVLPVLYIGVYNHPCAADDFQNARWEDYFGFQRSLYLHWSGRYFNNLAATLCPLHWRSLVGYRVAVMGIMAVFCVAFALTVARGLQHFAGIQPMAARAIGAMAMALLLNNFPSLAEGFFWFTGAVTYVLPATAALCLFALLISVDGNVEVGWGTIIAVSILAAAAIGGNESLLLLCCAVVAGGYIYYCRSGSAAHRRFYGRLLLVCIVCAAIAILAPGNIARQAVLQRNVWMVPPTWLYHSLRCFLNWIADPFLLLFSSLVMVVLWPLALRELRILNLARLCLAVPPHPLAGLACSLCAGLSAASAGHEYAVHFFSTRLAAFPALHGGAAATVSRCAHCTRMGFCAADSIADAARLSYVELQLSGAPAVEPVCRGKSICAPHAAGL